MQDLHHKARQGTSLLHNLKQKGVFTYLGFVALSFAIWYILAISERQENSIKVPIEYYNQPAGSTLLQDPPRYIEVQIKDVGQALLDYNIRGVKPLRINLANHNNDVDAFVVTHNNLISHMGPLFKNTTEIVSFKPDSISIRFTPEPGKKVPVIVTGNITAAHNRSYNNNATATPDSVTIYASAATLRETNAIYTQEIELNDLAESTQLNVQLKNIRNAKIIPDNVTVTVPIERYKTITLSVPITIENVPIQYQVTTIPRSAEIICIAPSNQEVRVEDFIIGDTFDITASGRAMPLKILQAPSYVSDIIFADANDTYECRIEEIEIAEDVTAATDEQD